MLGTNGGGFFGMNAAHPFENPTGLSNFFNTLAMMIFPFGLVLMYGRMLGRLRHAVVIFAVMMFMMVGTIVWSICYDTLQAESGVDGAVRGPGRTRFPTPNLADGAADVKCPPWRGCRWTSTWATWRARNCVSARRPARTFAAVTVDVTCGAVNCEHDSLNPLAALSPMVGMWLNCIFGGKGVGMINMLHLRHHRDLHGRA